VIQQKLNLYRLHFIDRKTGTIGHSHQFYAEDDKAAIEFAGVWAEDAPMELWGPKGRVKRWKSASNDQ
jgi:hypothetical protein